MDTDARREVVWSSLDREHGQAILPHQTTDVWRVVDVFYQHRCERHDRSVGGHLAATYPQHHQHTRTEQSEPSVHATGRLVRLDAPRHQRRLPIDVTNQHLIGWCAVCSSEP